MARRKTIRSIPAGAIKAEVDDYLEDVYRRVWEVVMLRSNDNALADYAADAARRAVRTVLESAIG
jgi:hypothetical protein